MPIPAIFLDVSLGYTRHNYEVDRPVSYVTLDGGRVSLALPGAIQMEPKLSFRALAGYDHNIGNFTIGPRVGVNYSHLTIDDYSESGGGGLALAYDEHSGSEITSKYGGRSGVSSFQHLLWRVGSTSHSRLRP